MKEMRPGSSITSRTRSAPISDSIMPAFRFPERSSGRSRPTCYARLTPPRGRRRGRVRHSRLCARCHGDRGNGAGADRRLSGSRTARPDQGGVHEQQATRPPAEIDPGRVAGTCMPPWGSC